MSGPNDIAVINARRTELLSNPHAGQKPTARYSSASAGVSVDSVNVPVNALGQCVANLMNRGKAPIMANGAEADFDNSKDVVDAIKSGKLKKIESIRFAEQFGLVQADKLDDLTPGAAMALLEQDANEDPTLINEVTTSQVVKPHDTYVKNGDQVGFEEQPKPQGKTNEESLMRHSVPSDSTVNQAKTEENSPKPKGEIHPEKMKPQMGTGAGGYTSNVNTSKEQSGNTAPEKVNIMKAEKLTNAAPVKYDDTYVKNGDSVNTEEMKKPEMVTDGYIENTPPVGNTDPSKSSDVNKSKPQTDMTMPEKSKVNPKCMPSVASKEVKADIMDMIGGAGGDAGAPPMPPSAPDMGGGDMPKDDGAPKGGHDHKPHMAPMKKVEEALELLTELTKIMETMENPIKQKAPKKNKSDGGGDKPKDDGAPKDDKPKDSGAEDNKFHEKHDKKDAPKDDKPKEDKPKSDGPSLPGILGYKVDFVNDVKSPTDSYYVVSLKDKPLFSVSAAQAEVKLEANNEDLTLDEFKSAEYANLLTNELNKQGAKEVFTTVFASKGVIAADGPMAPGATPPVGGSDTKNQSQVLPDDKFAAPPAKDMIPSPEVDNKISNNAPSKHSHIDLILEIAADALANSEGSTPEEFTDQLGEIFSDESKKRQFLGRLTEKVENKKKDMNANTQTPAGMQDMKSENDSLKAAINKLHPKVVALVKECTELKEKDVQNQKNAILKARASKTLEVAQKKADLGLIADSDVQNETIRLARLSNEELGKEVQELQNSIKIANKINQTNDCTNIENKVVNAVKQPINAVQAIPSQNEPELSKESNSKFPWSKGVFQGY